MGQLKLNLLKQQSKYQSSLIAIKPLQTLKVGEKLFTLKYNLKKI